MQCSRASRLILSDHNVNVSTMFIVDLSQIVNLACLTELVITCQQLRFEHLTIVLKSLVNIHVLTIPASILQLSLPQSINYPVKYQHTNIRKIIILDQCNFQDIHVLMNFSPYLLSLDIDMNNIDLPWLVHYFLGQYCKQNNPSRISKRFLSNYWLFLPDEYQRCFLCTQSRRFRSISDLHKHRPICNHRLSSLCCRNITYGLYFRIQSELAEQYPTVDHLIDYVDEKLHLWW
jgi:hypothetical protein